MIVPRDRRGEHPREHLQGWSGVLQADAYGGYGLYAAERRPNPILETACWAHARRNADIAQAARHRSQGKVPAVISPLALEAVQRIDALFAIEREIAGQDASTRLAVRQARSGPLLVDLAARMRAHRAQLSRGNPLARAMDYMLTRHESFARFMVDGRICLSNNAAERALRGIALGRKA